MKKLLFVAVLAMLNAACSVSRFPFVELEVKDPALVGVKVDGPGATLNPGVKAARDARNTLSRKADGSIVLHHDSSDSALTFDRTLLDGRRLVPYPIWIAGNAPAPPSDARHPKGDFTFKGSSSESYESGGRPLGNGLEEVTTTSDGTGWSLTTPWTNVTRLEMVEKPDADDWELWGGLSLALAVAGGLLAYKNFDDPLSQSLKWPCLIGGLAGVAWYGHYALPWASEHTTIYQAP